MSPTLGIRITRDRLLPDRTLGVVELDLPGDGVGWLPFGFSLEDTDRGDDSKVLGETAVPVGVYRVTLYDSPRFGLGTPMLLDVPGFRYILIHAGNGPGDTRGCILVGLNRTADEIRRSRLAVDWLCGEIRRVIRTGGRVSLEVRRAP